MTKEKKDYKTLSEIFALAAFVLIVGLILTRCEATSAKNDIEDLRFQIEKLEEDIQHNYDLGYYEGYDDGYYRGYENGLIDGNG